MFCADYENVKPDLFILGKALSGGYYPISAVVSKREVLGLFTPGTHGSTFGGNPLACAIAMAALDVIEQERLPERADKLGAYFYGRLRLLGHPLILDIRGRGLLLAIEFKRPIAHKFCEILMRHGVLAKDTHETTVRLAPPLVITRAQIDAVCAALAATLKELYAIRY
jgi:ornithine--oxo-acid transaminase